MKAKKQQDRINKLFKINTTMEKKNLNINHTNGMRTNIFLKYNGKF